MLNFDRYRSKGQPYFRELAGLAASPTENAKSVLDEQPANVAKHAKHMARYTLHFIFMPFALKITWENIHG